MHGECSYCLYVFQHKLNSSRKNRSGFQSRSLQGPVPGATTQRMFVADAFVVDKWTCQCKSVQCCLVTSEFPCHHVSTSTALKVTRALSGACFPSNLCYHVLPAPHQSLNQQVHALAEIHRWKVHRLQRGVHGCSSDGAAVKARVHIQQ